MKEYNRDMSPKEKKSPVPEPHVWTSHVLKHSAIENWCAKAQRSCFPTAVNYVDLR
jgi:hypothetical protein